MRRNQPGAFSKRFANGMAVYRPPGCSTELPLLQSPQAVDGRTQRDGHVACASACRGRVGPEEGEAGGFRAVWASVRVHPSHAGQPDVVGLTEATLARLGIDSADEDALKTVQVMVALRPRRRREDRL